MKGLPPPPSLYTLHCLSLSSSPFPPSPLSSLLMHLSSPSDYQPSLLHSWRIPSKLPSAPWPHHSHRRPPSAYAYPWSTVTVSWCPGISSGSGPAQSSRNTTEWRTCCSSRRCRLLAGWGGHPQAGETWPSFGRPNGHMTQPVMTIHASTYYRSPTSL